MKKFLQVALIFSLLLVIALPLTTFAQTGTAPACSSTTRDAGDIVCKIGSFIRSLIPLLVALGVVYFIWGVITYVIAGGDEAKTKGRDRIVYGIIGFAIIAGLWGLVFIVTNTFGVSTNGGIGAPDVSNLVAVPTSSSCSGRIAGNPKVADFMDYVTCIIGNSVIPLIFALAMVMFLWGAVQFLVIGAGDEAKRTRGKQLMIWGIIALTVMLGVWSLVGIVGGTFGIGSGTLPQVRPI